MGCCAFGAKHRLLARARVNWLSALGGLFAFPRLGRLYSQCKKGGRNRQPPEQEERSGVGTCSCLQYPDERWPCEAADVCNHRHEGYSGGRRRPGKELSRQRPKRAVARAVSQWNKRERKNRQDRLVQQGASYKAASHY